MPTFVTVRPPPGLVKDRDPSAPGGPPPEIEAVAPPPRLRAILLLAILGIADTLYLCYAHLFLGGVCLGGGGCRGVLESMYGRFLGIPLAALGLGLFAALALAAARRALGWARLFAFLGALPAPLLIYVQASLLKAWCPFCLVATGLLVTSAILSVRGGRAWIDLVSAPLYLAVLAAPTGLFVGVEHGLVARDVRRALAPAEAWVEIGGRRFKLDEIDATAEVTRLEWDKHRARLRWIEQEVLRREAEAQGLAVDEIVRRNVDYKVAVSDEEVQAAYRDQGGAGGPVPPEKRLSIAAQIVLSKRPAIEAEFVRELFTKYAVDVRLPLPGARETLEFNPRGGPERGPKDAPLSIVVFSDFSCPACARVHEWLAAAPKELGVPIRVAFRHMPVGLPGPAAFAAVAAHEQGRFWEFADVLFRNRATFDPVRLDAYASEAGLKLAPFDACVESERPKAVLAADAEEARRLGIKSAPTLFINGVHFAGVPHARVIRAILERDAAK
jgi:protein-disulfide isomerase/uncharacterized membrane protein